MSPVPAWRLVAVSTAAAERRFDSPLVGRERELMTLAEAWERARSGPGCELVTVVGAAGVGKSRLVGGVPRDRGRDGRPRTLPLLRRGDHLLAGRRGAEAARGAPVATRARSRSRPTRSPRSSAQGGTSSTDEIAWAFRKLLEAVAAEGPARRRLRRHPVGRGRLPRPPRARRVPVDRRSDPAALHGAAGAARPAERLGRRPAAGAARPRARRRR